MKKLFYISLLYFTFFNTGLAEVSQFGFITSEQRVDAGVLSAAITIQSQNSAGVYQAVTETTDLVFQSTSPTGKFVAISLKPTSKTMSKNTAKRTFYYIDPTPGSYTLTVKATGRSSKKTFTITQGIEIIGGGASVEVKAIATPVVATTTVPVVQTPVVIPKPQVKTDGKVKEKIESPKQLPVNKQDEEIFRPTEIKESTSIAAVIYTAPPKTSVLESFLWLPRKICSVVKSIFQ